jgi:hypothetical protein
MDNGIRILEALKRIKAEELKTETIMLKEALDMFKAKGLINRKQGYTCAPNIKSDLKRWLCVLNNKYILYGVRQKRKMTKETGRQIYTICEKEII